MDAIRSGKVSPIAGLPQMQMIAMDPEAFPDGVVLTLHKPGIALELLGTHQIPRGCVLAVIPPDVARQMGITQAIDAANRARAAKAGPPV